MELSQDIYWMLKMKIIEIKRRRENIIVWTEEYKDTGFNFKLDDITDVKDLKAKVQLRIDAEDVKGYVEEQRIIKFNILKEVVE